MRYSKQLAAVLFCILWVVGCNTAPVVPDNGDSLNPDSTPATQPISEEGKQEALSQLTETFRMLPHESNESDNELLAAAILESGAFRSARVGDGVVFATFIDGEDYVFFNDVPYEELLEKAGESAGAASRAARRDLPGGAPQGNGGTRMLLVNTSPNELIDGRLTNDALNAIRQMGTDRGYQVDVPRTSSYADFCSSFQGIDCMIWFGHGGMIADNYVFALPNFAEVNVDHPDMKNKIVTRGNQFDLFLSWEKQSVLVGTAEFVKCYWKFDKGAFLNMNTCHSAGSHSAMFQKACFTDAGLEAYVGWTAKSKFTDMTESAQVFVDMVTGANANYHQYHSDAGSEPSRAWSYRTTMDNMSTIMHKDALVGAIFNRYFLTRSYTGLTSDVLSELVYRHAGGSIDGGSDADSVFVPGIMVVGVDERAASPSRLLIDGSFGASRDDGKVTMNGSELNVTSWTHSNIVCDLPNDGDQAAGVVEVHRHGRTSNAVNLTLWNGPLYYTENYDCDDPDRIQWHTTHYGSMIVKFRGDVHHYRTHPAARPQAPAIGLSAMQGQSLLTDYYSLGTVQEPHFDEQRREVGRTIDTYSRGPGTSTPEVFSKVDGHLFFTLRFQPEQHNAVLTHVSFNIVNGEHIRSELQSPVLPSVREYDSNLDLSLRSILQLVDPTLMVRAESFDTGSFSQDRMVDTTFTSGNGDAQGKIRYSLQVGPFSAMHAPDDSAAR